MPFDPQNPIEWINEITQNEPQFIRCLCKSLYWESHLVRLPARALLCKWGMTRHGRVGVIDENDPVVTQVNMPPPERMLPAGDAQYDALVRQEDPEAQQPSAFGFAAYKHAGGHVPQPVGHACAWRILPIYATLTGFVVGNRDAAATAARHFTQSAGWVAVHPTVFHLMDQHACIENTLRARAFTAFGYDPTGCFAPQAEHDNCGFMI